MISQSLASAVVLGWQQHPREESYDRRRVVRNDLIRLCRKKTAKRLARMVSELVNHRNLVHARDGAKWRARLYRMKFPFKVFRAILIEGNSRHTLLLGAIMD